MEGNKYNLQVGDVITLISDWTISEITEHGCMFDNSNMLNTWERLNKNLGNGNWKIKSRVKNMKVEAPKTFAIKSDSKHLLKACFEELETIGYKRSPMSRDREFKDFICINLGKINSSCTLEDYAEIYINGNLIPTSDIIFTLPQDYNKAIEHAKSAISSPYWAQNKVKKMKFGSLEVEVEQGKGYVQIAEGRVTKEDLEKVIDYFSVNNRPKILGYTINFEYSDINFGCKSGTVKELIAIYESM